MARLRIGLMGLGRHGIRYASHLVARDAQHGELAAVWRRNARRAGRQARQLDVAFVPRWPDLVARQDVDAVVAVVPPGLHLDISRVCAQFGKPLLVEKPLAPSVRDGRRMLVLMGRKGLPFMVAQTLRFADPIRRLKEAIRRRAPLYVLHLAQHLQPRNLEWETLPEHGAGGILHQIGIHVADLARFLSGRQVAAVSCVTRRVHNPCLPDIASARLELDDGAATALFEVSKAGSARCCRIEAVTAGGVLMADYLKGWVSTDGGTTVKETPLNPTVVDALEGFCRAVLKGTAPPVPAEEGLESLAVVEACHRSARAKGRRTAVERRA